MDNTIIQENIQEMDENTLYKTTDCDTCLENKEHWTIEDMEAYTHKPQFTEHRLYICSECQKYVCISFISFDYPDIGWEFFPKKEFINRWNEFVSDKDHMDRIPII